MGVGDFLTTAKITTEEIFRIPQNIKNLDVKIDNQELKKFSGLTIESEIDSPCVAFSFTTVFEPSDRDSRELFRPFKKRLIDITYWGTNVCQGYIDIVTPATSDSGIQVNVQGRSANAWMVDSNRKGDLYFRNITLGQFAKQVSNGAISIEPDTQPIPIIKVEKTEKVYEAVAKEAAQRGYWCVPSAGGNITFTKISQSDPIQAELTDGISPVLTVRSSFDRTKRFGEYLIIGSGNGTGRSATITDSEIVNQFGNTERFKIVQASKENADLQKYGERVRSQDQIDSMTLDVVCSSWTFNDKLWQPGGMIQLEAPGAMIYRPSKFVIKKVTLKFDEGGEEATLSLALPNAFDGSTLSEFPWDEPIGSVNGILPGFGD